jgi:hypothetical protein
MSNIYTELSELSKLPESPNQTLPYLMLQHDVPYDVYCETVEELNSTKYILKELVKYTTHAVQWAEYWKNLYDTK